MLELTKSRTFLASRNSRRGFAVTSNVFPESRVLPRVRIALQITRGNVCITLGSLGGDAFSVLVNVCYACERNLIILCNAEPADTYRKTK